MNPVATMLQSLTREQRESVECLLVRFDQHWQADRLRAEIAKLQDIDDDAQLPALVELVKIDMENQWQLG